MRSYVNVSGTTDIEKLLSELSIEAPCGSSEKTMLNQRDVVKFRVLRLLEANPRMSHREIAKAIGGSTGAVNYCINALIEKGMVKVSNFRSSDNKLRYAYILTPEGINENASLTVSFLRRKFQEFHAIQLEISEILAETGVNEHDQFRFDD